MTGQYGSNWGNNFGFKPSEEWSTALDGIQEWIVAIALEQCFERNSPWPPMLPEFMMLCRTVPAHKNPKVSSAPQLEDKSKGPGHHAYIDLCKSGLEPGQPGYMEFYQERLKFHQGEAGSSC
jgi:hypothetical protein